MPSRRQVLAAGCLAVAGGAGCSQIRDAVETERGDGTETGGTDDATQTGNATEETTVAEADDLRITVTDGDDEVELATGRDVATVGDVQASRQGDGYWVPVTLTAEGTDAFADRLEQVGAFDDPDAHQIRTYFEGEMLYEATLGHDLIDAMETGKWDGSFLLTVTDRETAEQVRDALKDE